MAGIRRSDLDAAVREGILDAAQADRLASFLDAVPAAAAEPRFSFVHVLYYLGGMIAIGAMSLLMTLGWNALGGRIRHHLAGRAVAAAGGALVGPAARVPAGAVA